MIGALDEIDLTNEHYITSRPYYHDKITWCVQKQQPIKRWKSFFRTCTDPLVLVLFPLTMIFVVFFSYFMQQFEDMKPKWDCFRIAFAGLRAVFGLGVGHNPYTTPYRIYFISSILIHTVTTTLIVSFVLKAINDPRLEHQVATINEIIDTESAFELVGNRFALQQLIRQNEVSILNNICHSFH